jgi:hypothetical protein
MNEWTLKFLIYKDTLQVTMPGSWKDTIVRCMVSCIKYLFMPVLRWALTHKNQQDLEVCFVKMRGVHMKMRSVPVKSDKKALSVHRISNVFHLTKIYSL